MQRTKIILLVALAVIAVTAITIWFWRVGPNKRQVCPEAWYDNHMPGPAERTAGSSQYFIVNGQRVEFAELDVDWVKANCSVKEPELVY
ncbi:MAG TPA: hypothetical protein VFT87_00890 [Candidatus Saccharimonadales bacterium]|nr:hypothetical protein [Candidatus Saccharimonadales bacterium]